MLKKKAKISIWFILVIIVFGLIWWMFGDIKTAALVFLGYAAIRIIANFLKGKPREAYYGY